jgi:CRP/FNR family transcriptional regulator, nitrogen oxide reductase regulator
MTVVGQRSPFVKISELFTGLPDSVYAKLLSIATPRQFICGEVIFWAGNPITEVLLLTHGRAKITLLNSYGSEVILRLVAPGEIIGALGLGQGDMHSSTAQAVEPCRVVVWGAASFEAATKRFPVLRRNATRIVERRLCELERRFCEISTETVSPRLAHTLVRLIEQIGHKVNSYHKINLPQRMLAQMTAMDPCTVNRVLSKWEEQGLVSLGREVIVIRDYDSLSSLYK